jgi:lia operon protein LiaG
VRCHPRDKIRGFSVAGIMKKWIILIVIVVILMFVMASGLALAALKSDSAFFRIPREMIQSLLSGEKFSFGLLTNTFDIDEISSDSVKGINRIEILTVSSDITIHLTDSSDIEVTLKGVFRTTGNKPVRLEKSKKGSALSFKVEYPKGRINSSSDMKMDVYLPKSYENTLKVTTVSGDIMAKELLNEANIFDSVSGNIKIDKILFSDVKATMVSGDAIIGLETVREKAVLDINSVSGNIRLDFAKPLGANKNKEDIKVETVSGHVDIYLPDNSSFTVKYESTSGKLSSDFPMTIESSGKFSSSGTINQGNGQIKVQTVSGKLSLYKN